MQETLNYFIVYIFRFINLLGNKNISHVKHQTKS